MQKAVYPGSFDPPTTGHQWMIEQGAQLFDELVVSIGTNPEKTYWFTAAERASMLTDITDEYGNVSVEQCTDQLLADYASRIDASYLLRGVRDVDDFREEQRMRHLNNDIQEDVETVFLTPPRDLSDVSSTLVRGLVKMEGWEETVHRFVPETVYTNILEKADGSLAADWINLCDTVNPEIEPGPLYRELVAAYREPHRSYHTLDHVQHCLQELETVADVADNEEALRFATWYHDIIYEPGNPENEERSAEKAWNAAKYVKNEEFAGRVAQLVAATDHPCHPDDGDAQLLHDIDLAILGASWNRFTMYENGIREEYSEVPTEIYERERNRFLDTVLEQPQIYAHPVFRERYEEQARENIHRLQEQYQDT